MIIINEFRSQSLSSAKEHRMQTFIIIWFGQFISRVGTALTRFALLIWAYQQTESALAVALLGFFSFLPVILVSPFAGVWVDRLERRTVMILADSAAGLATAALLLLHVGGGLQVWHLYALVFLAGTFEAFQSPAYLAATTLLLPKEEYARASGLRSLAENGAMMLSPVLAGLLLLWLGITDVMLIDLATFLFALGTLLIVRIPPLKQRTESRFWQEMRVGFRYIWDRPGLAGLTFAFTGMNFFAALTYFSTLPAMILARSGNSELALAWVQAALGSAGVVGAVGVSIWGGPRHKIHGVLLAAALSFLLGDMVLAVGRTLPIWVIGGLIGAIFIPVIGSSNDAIWQAKVDPALQGRVFAAKAMGGQLLAPVGYLLGGLLADRWFEPAMMAGGALAGSFGWLVGSGPGAGIALMFVLTSLLGGLMCLAAYLFPAVRNVEDDLPDHEYRQEPAEVMSYG
jgi:MFS transporter, DHA3 family, macrolide efflux protein